jgi:hypothetical protein
MAHMPALTRRRYPERPDCWHVYYGDVHVGTIATRAGVPVDVGSMGRQYPTIQTMPMYMSQSQPSIARAQTPI